MRYVRAEEGDESTPATIRRFMQVVPSPTAPRNGHKRTPAHAAPPQVPQADAAPAAPVASIAAPAPTALPPAAPTPAQPSPSKSAPPEPAAAHAAPVKPAPADATPAKSSRAHAAPAGAVTIHAPKAHSPTTRAVSPKHLYELGAVQPVLPRIPPEVLDACVVALRRMGGPALQTVGVTSSVRGEGRSTVAAAMAVTHASEYRRRTILVECDAHKSPAARRFRLAESPGVAEVMRGDVNIEDCIQWVTDHLGVVVAGADPSMAALLRGSAAEDIVEELSRQADTLVLDLPPLEKGAGGVQLVDLCEAVALVVRAGVSRHQLEDATAALTTPPFVILNGVKSAAPRWVRRLLGLR